MSDPTSLHKPYTTGAEPSTTASKANVHMSPSGWVRTITATDYAWAGNDDANSDEEVLVAFRGGAENGWYAYTYWANASAISNTTRVAISLHVHFQENVTVTGNPTITITNGREGGGTQATVTATYVSNTIKHICLFRSAVPGNNHLKEDDILSIGVNALSLAGGTIKDEGTSTNSIITNAAADGGYHASPNRGGDMAADGTTIQLDGPRVAVTA